MSKFNLNKLAPMIKKAGPALTKLRRGAVEVVKDRNFQMGLLAALPTGIGGIALIRKYQKQVTENEQLYKKALAKHNAIIKELNTKAEINKERQDRLLAYDSELKKEMRRYRSEILELKEQIAKLEKKTKDD